MKHEIGSWINPEDFKGLDAVLCMKPKERALLAFLCEPETQDVLRHVAYGFTADASFYSDRIDTLLSMIGALDDDNAR